MICKVVWWLDNFWVWVLYRAHTPKSFCCKGSTPWIITVLFLVYSGLAVIKLSSTSNHPIRASYSINTVFWLDNNKYCILIGQFWSMSRKLVLKSLMTQKVNHLCSDWLILEYEYETKLVLKNLMTVRSDGKSTTFVYVNILKFDYLHSQRENQKKNWILFTCMFVW
jgi:hypothetical protein